MKKYADAIVVVPLEEEFEIVLSMFKFVEDLSDEKQIIFSVSVPDRTLTILLAKQSLMGKTGAQQAILNCLDRYDAGLLVCVGIAGGLSSDLAIGDVCYTGVMLDVLDNAKATDTKTSNQDLALSPTSYTSPPELGILIALDRLNPSTKPQHEAWAEERERIAHGLIPHEFSGQNGKKETIRRPTVREGSIACGLVSGSLEYNRKLKAIDRKILAIETESGALFAIANQRDIPAFTVRGISDYAGIDKNKFEVETQNKGRQIAAGNAASFLSCQLGTAKMIAYFDKLRTKRANDESQLPLLPAETGDDLFDVLVRQSDAFNKKLRDLAPGHSLHTKGYRLPIPRIRTIDTRSTGHKAKETAPLELREALREARIITLHVPKEYPDLSLAWIIASDLVSAQVGEKKVVPWVVAGNALQGLLTNIAQIIGPQIKKLDSSSIVQNVIIIDNFDFDSRSRLNFLKKEIDAWPDAKFIVMTHSQTNVVLESDFARNTASCIANLCDVSFMEISFFLQKNFEMTASASEVVALRLRDTFHRYALPAHPSYFAGIPKSTLSALLQVNRRAELIELAVAGYLSFVVSEDSEPLIKLSRTTREKFLAELAFQMSVEGRSFTESSLTIYAEQFSKRFDFQITPARFVALFIHKGILHEEAGSIRFTLTFIESYLLAKRLTESPLEAARYFSAKTKRFDHRSFTLYAELGAAENIVSDLLLSLDASISRMSGDGKIAPILLDPSVCPALLRRQDRLNSIQKQLQKAEEDVSADRDQSHAKQRFLDAADRVREEAGAKLYRAEAEADIAQGDNKQIIQEEDVVLWSVAVALLGSGAERLEAKTKRELVSKIVKLSCAIVDVWTKARYAVKFDELKDRLGEDEELASKIAKSNSQIAMDEAKRTIKNMIEWFEYIFVLQPFVSIVGHLCEEARDAVLAESISKTSTTNVVEELCRTLWLSDINVQMGRKSLLRSIKALPNGQFLRAAIAGQIMARVYWRHWIKKDRLDLLKAATESLVGSGLQYNQSELKRIIEKLPDAEDRT